MMKRRGFSLLELILVIVLTTVLTASVVSVYLTSIKIWNAGEDRTGLRTSLALSVDMITQDLSNATNISLENVDNSLYFNKDGLGYRWYLYSADDPGQAYNNDNISYDLIKTVVNDTYVYGMGTVWATGIQRSVFAYANNLVTVDMTATKNSTIVHVRTKIRPRN
ncbi:MAG: prepilin-type N-terminal cleavage/methylation domain-containing protein [Candidatus Omnitrophica bacterium]|nr:prepilin-type N-terminal cleavage/methylation domain-containing protein [Candidatus Omnitrophota bacterium]